ncbi:hypothetical protein SCAR479_13445 [Seiridium cardinale]|uniref:Kelch repeat protein n=1 Tax=Seiridium cardinale TaxID=138064 RepID=A0ABR2X834_9PEZI
MIVRRSIALLCSIFSVGANGIDTYSSSDYIRRTGHALAVIGKRLYIDGGEVAELHDGKPESQATRQMNDTLSIPLDVAWTNKTVPITSIAKAAPVFDNSALWTDQTSGSMYMWGGQGPWGNLSKTRDLWKFSADGESWTKQPAANADVFMSLKRSSYAAITQCNGMGFFIGGIGSVWTDQSFAAGDLSVPVPGMLTYNLTSGVWANESTAGMNSYETYISGTAACLPSFGTSGKGMIMTLGGEISRREGYNSSEPNLVSLGNLTFWDIETESWFSQEATGDIPTPRSKSCIVDVEGPNGTHEIFLFGGYDTLNLVSFQDVYVLSIPGFVWVKADVTTGGPRTAQQCIVAGNRQMIVVGGKNPDLNYIGGYRDPDPWTNGINVLDMTSLSWNSAFDPNAAAYESPSAVIKWYSDVNQDHVTWTSDSVKSLFVENSTSSGSSSSTSSEDSSSSRGSSGPVGAIVGGAVGGVAALTLAGLAFWFFRRRKNNHSTIDVQPPIQVAGGGHPYYPTPPPLYDPHRQEKAPQEIGQEREAVMMATDERPSELENGHWSQGQWQQGHRNVHEMA